MRDSLGMIIADIKRSTGWQMAMGFAACLFSVYAALLFGHRVAPNLTDFADWTYSGVLLHQRLVSGPDGIHLLKPYPVPNSAATVGIGLLNFLLPWKLAAKAWLVLYLLVSFLVTRHMMRTRGMEGSAALWLIVPTATYLNLNFWYGFVNFQLGLCCVVFTASLLLRMEKGTGKNWVLGGLLLLTFFVHMIPFVLGCLMVGFFALQTGRYRVLWQIVPGALASAWYVAGRALIKQGADNEGMMSAVRSYTAAFWGYKGNSYLKSFGFVNPFGQRGSITIGLLGDAGYGALFGVNVVLCGLLGWCIWQAARRAFQEKRGERFLWMAAACLLPIYLLAPGDALGVSDPGSRVLQAALAVMLVLSGRPSRALTAAACCSLVLCGWGAFLFSWVPFSSAWSREIPSRLPQAVELFAHLSNDNQQYYYEVLDRGDLRLRVFSTGLFVAAPPEVQKAEPPPVGDGSAK